MYVFLETMGKVAVDNVYNTRMFYPGKEDSAAPEIRFVSTNRRY